MSDENVGLVRRAVQAANDRDVEGMLDCFASDAVVDWSRSHGINARVFRGHSELRGILEDFWEAFDALFIDLVEEPSELEDGLVLAENITYFRGRDGGVRVEAHSVWLITIQGGKETSLTLYQTREEALEAARLRE